MKITKSCFEKLINTVNANREFGGIIGCSDNNVIVRYQYDEGIDVKGMPACCYVPDIETLNKVIASWSEDGIAFCGMYHSHFSDVGSFSDQDKEYIRDIIKSMPDERKNLYFPLLLMPAQKLIVYLAYLDSSGTLKIEPDDDIAILDEEGGEINDEGKR